MTYEVGYKRPPTASRWTKGKSGNPTGRKRGQRNLATDLAEELSAVIQVSEGGKPVKLSKQRLMIKGLVARSIKGEPRAVSELLKLMLRSAAEPDGQPANAPIPAEDEALVAAFLARNTIR